MHAVIRDALKDICGDRARTTSILYGGSVNPGNASALLAAEGVDGLLVGGAIWLTNVILFSVWYWGADRGGAVQRMLGTHERPDFLFPQMQLEDAWAKEWEPQYVDYLYFAFTTLTTTGYGDLSPASDVARAAAILEALLGQLYLVTVLALVIGNLRPRRRA